MWRSKAENVITQIVDSVIDKKRQKLLQDWRLRYPPEKTDTAKYIKNKYTLPYIKQRIAGRKLKPVELFTIQKYPWNTGDIPLAIASFKPTHTQNTPLIKLPHNIVSFDIYYDKTLLAEVRRKYEGIRGNLLFGYKGRLNKRLTKLYQDYYGHIFNNAILTSDNTFILDIEKPKTIYRAPGTNRRITLKVSTKRAIKKKLGFSYNVLNLLTLTELTTTEKLEIANKLFNAMSKNIPTGTNLTFSFTAKMLGEYFIEQTQNAMEETIKQIFNSRYLQYGQYFLELFKFFGRGGKINRDLIWKTIYEKFFAYGKRKIDFRALIKEGRGLVQIRREGREKKLIDLIKKGPEKMLEIILDRYKKKIGSILKPGKYF